MAQIFIARNSSCGKVVAQIFIARNSSCGKVVFLTGVC